MAEIEDADGNMWDILVQVRRGTDDLVLTFTIGDLMRQELEGDGDWSGMLQVTDERAAVLLRWAEQLEAYAQIMRSALKCRRPA